MRTLKWGGLENQRPQAWRVKAEAGRAIGNSEYDKL